MRFIIVLLLLSAMVYACGGGSEEPKNPPFTTNATRPDDGKGIGEIKEVTLNDPLDQNMVDRGRGIYEMKCAACHKLSAQRVVGPGWKGLSTKRKPEWIMNMIVNVEVMLEQDPEAQKLLEECLTRMPNQNLNVEDARDILEFIYANDAVAE